LSARARLASCQRSHLSLRAAHAGWREMIEPGLQRLNRNVAADFANDRQIETIVYEIALIGLKVGDHDLK
jgi:hypothetical protein